LHVWTTAISGGCWVVVDDAIKMIYIYSYMYIYI
jgi:hypothetical protein